MIQKKCNQTEFVNMGVEFQTEIVNMWNAICKSKILNPLRNSVIKVKL